VLHLSRGQTTITRVSPSHHTTPTQPNPMNTLKSISTSDWGQSIHSCIKSLVPLVVAIYCSGEWLGHYIHSLNTSLAQFHVHLFYPNTKPKPNPTQPQPAPSKPKVAGETRKTKPKTTRRKPTTTTSETLSKPKKPRPARRARKPKPKLD